MKNHLFFLNKHHQLTCTRSGKTVYRLIKILSWNVIKWGLFFDNITLVLHTLLLSGLHCLNTIGEESFILLVNKSSTTDILNSSTGYAHSIYLIFRRLPYLHHHVVSTINVFLVGGSCRASRPWFTFKTHPSLKFSCPLLHYYKAGVSFTNVATMPALMFLDAKPVSVGTW